MTDKTARSRRIKAAALLGGGLAAGVIGATALGATAEDSASTPSSTTSAGAPAPGERSGAHGTETEVTGSKAETLKAAALAKFPGATVDRVETDSGAAAYEVHLTKADGTHVTVVFDANLKYVGTETGPDGRHGGPGGGRGDETEVSGAKADTLKAAALAQVPGATVDRVETDSGDAAYEVHLTKADGSHVTAKFDANLKFVGVEEGMGK